MTNPDDLARPGMHYTNTADFGYSNTCYATYKPEAWAHGCSGTVGYHRRADMFLCVVHRREYDGDFSPALEHE